MLLFSPIPSRYVKTRFGIYPTAEHKKYIVGIRRWMENHRGHFDNKDEPLAMTIAYFFKKPKKTIHEYPVVPPDLDNLTKPVLDALKPEFLKRVFKSAGVIPDDACVTDLYLRKRYTNKSAKIIINIWKIEQTSSGSTDSPIQELLNLMPTPMKLQK